ncbi:MAG: hypothetical protein FJ126_12875 [Deltaproteobacteria bacterium]|nr:hypothetical protein [Deltaproteobacteria bacterium]
MGTAKNHKIKNLVAHRGLKAATKLKNDLITLIKSRCYRQNLREKTRNSDSVAQASGLGAILDIPKAVHRLEACATLLGGYTILSFKFNKLNM